MSNLKMRDELASLYAKNIRPTIVGESNYSAAIDFKAGWDANTLQYSKLLKAIEYIRSCHLTPEIRLELKRILGEP